MAIEISALGSGVLRGRNESNASVAWECSIETPEVGSRADRNLRIVDRLPVWPPSLISFLLENLAETSHPPSLPSPHDGHMMIPRVVSSVTKRRVTLASPTLQRDASTGPSVDVKSRTALPRLPVPPLRSTLDKYLQSIKPLLLEDDLRGVSAFDLAYQQRVQWAKEFEVGIGATLQARLIGICCVLSIFAVISSHT